VTRRVAISAVVEVNPGMPASIRDGDGDRLVPFLPMSAVSEAGYASYGERRALRELLKGYTYFERGDVLIAKITPCLENGKAASLDDLPDALGFGSTEFHVLRPGPDVDARYLFHAVWNNAFRKAAVSSFTGSAGQKRLPASFFDRYKVPLPPLVAQRRIAAMLDKADAVRRKRRESLRLLDEFLRSAFLEMFGDPVRNEKGREVVRLEAIADIVSGVTKGRKLRNYPVQDVPYLRVANVQDGSLDLGEMKTIPVTRDEIAQYRLEAGDILLTEGGDPDKLGRGAIWRDEIRDCIHQNHVFRVRLRDAGILAEYVSALVGSAYGKRYFLKAAKQTTGIASINRTQLGSFPVLKAPRELQERYAAAVTGLRILRGHFAAASTGTDHLFECLATLAFAPDPSRPCAGLVVGEGRRACVMLDGRDVGN